MEDEELWSPYLKAYYYLAYWTGISWRQFQEIPKTLIDNLLKELD